MPQARAEAMYRLYMEFFEKGERNRRWNVFDDIPWSDLDAATFRSERAMTAETFCAIEMYLPDYVSRVINLVRNEFGQAWFVATWGYEESKHGLALREYLVRSGQRSVAQMSDYVQAVLARQWELPFLTPRQMTAYGLLQEATTLMSYRKELEAVEQAGDRVLAAIYRFIARDEAAHAHFYLQLFKVLLEEDPDGALVDLAQVFAHFEMPGPGLVPDYERRLAVVRSSGIDRAAFLAEVWLPTLRKLGIRRCDLGAVANRTPGAVHSRSEGT